MKTTKKVLSSISGAVLLAFSATPVATMASDELELLEPGVLSTATEGAFAPFSFRSANGELQGFEIAVIQEVADRMGLEHRPVVTKWESILVGLQADQYDMISNPMGITAERQEAVYFANAWVESGAKLVVSADSDIDSLAQAKGKSVGVIVASTFVPMAEELGGDVKLYKSDPEALQDLVNGQIDAVITDAVAGSYAIKTAGLDLRMVDEFIESYQMGWAIKKDNSNLVRAVNAALDAMIADGTYAQLAEEIIGTDPTPADPIKSNL
ncbi:MAG: transporter substrate-binding domain-containing protein [Granulosicoccus sp.]